MHLNKQTKVFEVKVFPACYYSEAARDSAFRIGGFCGQATESSDQGPQKRVPKNFCITACP